MAFVGIEEVTRELLEWKCGGRDSSAEMHLRSGNKERLRDVLQPIDAPRWKSTRWEVRLLGEEL